MCPPFSPMLCAARYMQREVSSFLRFECFFFPLFSQSSSPLLHREHLFRVWLLGGSDMASYSKLKATCQVVLNLGLAGDYWTGIMTADKRDSWSFKVLTGP